MKLTEEQYKQKYPEDDASPGWDAIDRTLEKVYGNTEPRHYGTIIKYMLGGEDPLDGISIYDNAEQQFHRHIVSYGMSELYYSPESVGNEFSGWGFEFTFRIIPFVGDKDADKAKNEPYWAMNLMQNLAKYVFNSKKWFEAYHFIPANGPIRLDSDTKLVGIAFVPDPQLGVIETPHGEVSFLQMVGLTQEELDWLWQDPKTSRVEELVNKMREDNPLLITDLARVKSYV
ncbi:riboflavin biosynthesis protein [Capnocytophaga canimorsus]|uniref:suppressor of fused domain protein n=1 Tax=Capnocytophaga canimorsus TaxID=28188 RepID=UPI000D6E3C12|nr:suppressor of fused domain protein [Capnocytophaga canimorsus]AWL77553.1 riboflavin biosynthesis protein [Capnocytophaga canimorsus]